MAVKFSESNEVFEFYKDKAPSPELQAEQDILAVEIKKFLKDYGQANPQADMDTVKKAVMVYVEEKFSDIIKKNVATSNENIKQIIGEQLALQIDKEINVYLSKNLITNNPVETKEKICAHLQAFLTSQQIQTKVFSDIIDKAIIGQMAKNVVNPNQKNSVAMAEIIQQKIESQFRKQERIEGDVDNRHWLTNSADMIRSGSYNQIILNAVDVVKAEKNATKPMKESKSGFFSMVRNLWNSLQVMLGLKKPSMTPSVSVEMEPTSKNNTRHMNNVDFLLGSTEANLSHAVHHTKEEDLAIEALDKNEKERVAVVDASDINRHSVTSGNYTAVATTEEQLIEREAESPHP